MENKKNNKIQPKHEKNLVTENYLQSVYNYICQQNKCNVLDVIYSDSQGITNELARKQIIDDRIAVAVKKAYPDYKDTRNEVDNLFILFSNLLQYSQFSDQIAMGKLLIYIDYVHNNNSVNLKRRIGAEILRNMNHSSELPFALKGNKKAVLSEISRIQNEGLRIDKEQIDYANKYCNVLNFYRNNTKVEIDLINFMIDYFKKAGKLINQIDNKLAKATDQRVKTRYMNLKREADKKVNEALDQMLKQKRSKSNNSVLVDFMRICYDEFIKYYGQYDSISENMNWFVNEYLQSKASYDEVMSLDFDINGPSQFGYNFKLLMLKYPELNVGLSDAAVKTINYDSLQRRLKKGSSR